MAQMDGSTPDAEASSSRTPRAVLPPPPVAGLRNVARARGAFDESRPTLRLPRLPPSAEGLADDDAPPSTPGEPVRLGAIDVRGLRPVGARPVSPRTVLLRGPQLVEPIERTLVGRRPPATPASRLIDEIEDPEEIEEAEDAFERSPTLALPAAPRVATFPDDDTLPAGDVPGETMPGAPLGDAASSMHAQTLADGDRRALASDDPGWSAHGAPVVAIPHDPTPIVSVPALAVPPPVKLVHAIVAPARVVRPRRRWWLAALVPVAVAMLGVGVWAREPADPTPAIATSVPTLEDARPLARTDTLPELNGPPTPVPPAVPIVPMPAMPPAPVVPADVVALAATPDEPVIELAAEDDPRPPTVAAEAADAPSVAAASPSPAGATTPRTKGKTKKKKKNSSRKRSATRTVAAAKPAPAPAEPPVAIVRAPGAGNDAKALLREAERAFAEGRYATALHFADRSRAKQADPRAARIAAMSACRIGNARKAKAAWSSVAASQRGAVRKTCRDRGIEI